eukprot:4666827-Amphidinium_carterae.1
MLQCCAQPTKGLCPREYATTREKRCECIGSLGRSLKFIDETSEWMTHKTRGLAPSLQRLEGLRLEAGRDAATFCAAAHMMMPGVHTAIVGVASDVFLYLSQLRTMLVPEAPEAPNTLRMIGWALSTLTEERYDRLVQSSALEDAVNFFSEELQRPHWRIYEKFPP